MQRVLRPGGTAWRVGAGLKYSMGGKTGTAQVVQIAQGKSYNAAALREQHRDHAWFIAFAPAENPQIAIAVILENAGWGANAAPLARQLADFYLLRLKAGQVAGEETRKRRTANPLLEMGLPLNTGKNPVQAAFEAAAQERAKMQAASAVGQ